MQQKLDLQRLMTDAKEDAKSIEKLSGDWRTQLQMLNRTVAVVTTYQKAIHRAFSTPRGHKKGRSVIFELPDGVVAIEELRELEELQFRGACLVQTLEVVHHAESHAFGTTIKYKAVLKVDENYFLMQMLPRVKNLRNADPDYDIYNLTIDVPKGELVAESLRMLNERLGEEPKEPQGPRSPNPFPEDQSAWAVFGGRSQFAPVPSTLGFLPTSSALQGSGSSVWKAPARHFS